MSEMHPVENPRISSHYGESRPGGRIHIGTDYAAPTGTPILSRNGIAGTVIRRGYGSAAGHWLETLYTDDVKEMIMHLVEPGLSVGSKVVSRDTLGKIGATGNATGPNVHVEIRINNQTVNPALFYGGQIGPQPPSQNLRYGSTGNSVGILQAGLNKVFPLYSNLKVDNIFGALTEKVVKEFQRRSGITIDGIVGPITKAHLRKYGIVV